jgi:hypothetical protein
VDKKPYCRILQYDQIKTPIRLDGRCLKAKNGNYTFAGLVFAPAFLRFK